MMRKGSAWAYRQLSEECVRGSAQKAVLLSTVRARLACFAAADLPPVASTGPAYLPTSLAARGLDEGIARAAIVAQYGQREYIKQLQQLSEECGGSHRLVRGSGVTVTDRSPVAVDLERTSGIQPALPGGACLLI